MNRGAWRAEQPGGLQEPCGQKESDATEHTKKQKHNAPFQFISCSGFPGGSAVKNLLANAGDMGLIPGSGRSPGEGNGNPLQYSCLGNPMDRGAWQVTVRGVAKSQARLCI